MKTKIALETAKMLLEIKAVTLSPRKPYKFTSGLLSPIYIDNRIIISYPKIREKITGFYISIIKEKIGLENVELVSGTATAAIPQAAFIAQKINIPMVFVRNTKKGHGKQNQIEGIVKKGQKVVIIEDLISTGGSAIGNALAIRDAGGKVEYGVATATYMMKKAEAGFKKINLQLLTLTNYKELITTAVQEKYINEKESKIVLEWAINPPEWGRKFGFEK